MFKLKPEQAKSMIDIVRKASRGYSSVIYSQDFFDLEDLIRDRLESDQMSVNKFEKMDTESPLAAWLKLPDGPSKEEWDMLRYQESERIKSLTKEVDRLNRIIMQRDTTINELTRKNTDRTQHVKCLQEQIDAMANDRRNQYDELTGKLERANKLINSLTGDKNELKAALDRVNEMSCLYRDGIKGLRSLSYKRFETIRDIKRLLMECRANHSGTIQALKLIADREPELVGEARG